MSVEYLNFEDLSEIDKKIFLVFEDEVNRFCGRFLHGLGFVREIRKISKVTGTLIFSYCFSNDDFKRKIKIVARRQIEFDSYMGIPEDTLDIFPVIEKITDVFLWGGEIFFVDKYLEDIYKLKLTYRETYPVSEIKNVILKVSSLKEEELRQKMREIISMYEYYLKDDEKLYKCLTGEIWLDEYCDRYK
ncbi:hypothetical protein [Thermoflavifilum thermophilum]|uniref:Uncharacterized protein n=1 Tax=Thermoflavifilum thermophilum TaxID=1393122 RepID=A0A1I7NGD3_9BACT|nr:hypothetical protein [Thermoflavifilum thermophilum]SFV33721.1 hypothetical protein SAMN05660895_1791 [Thermoflavifilum thermophilum]